MPRGQPLIRIRTREQRMRRRMLLTGIPLLLIGGSAIYYINQKAQLEPPSNPQVSNEKPAFTGAVMSTSDDKPQPLPVDSIANSTANKAQSAKTNDEDTIPTLVDEETPTSHSTAATSDQPPTNDKPDEATPAINVKATEATSPDTVITTTNTQVNNTEQQQNTPKPADNFTGFEIEDNSPKLALPSDFNPLTDAPQISTAAPEDTFVRFETIAGLEAIVFSEDNAATQNNTPDPTEEAATNASTTTTSATSTPTNETATTEAANTSTPSNNASSETTTSNTNNGPQSNNFTINQAPEIITLRPLAGTAATESPETPDPEANTATTEPEAPTPETRPPSPLPLEGAGWIYAGQFSNGNWREGALKIGSQLPQNGQNYQLNRGTRLRDNPPGRRINNGKSLGNPIGYINSGQTVQILQVKNSGRSGHIWLKIKP